MKKIVQNLTKIASSLDSQKRIKLASQIDKFADALVQIKTAQYVGVQGYWIRNERCWSNCYRQKRAETPKKASQVVWQECQNEYVESINNPTSGWEKYAQDEKQMKFSEADQKIIKAEQDYFRETVAKKVGNGMFPTVAVYDTIEQRKAKYVKDQIKLANSMLQFAEDMGQNGFKKEAKSLAAEASELIKEAGFFNDMWQGAQGKGEIYKRMQAAFNQWGQTIQGFLEKLSTNAAGYANPKVWGKNKQFLNNKFEQGRQILQGYENQAAAVSPFASRKVKKLQTQFETTIRPILGSIMSATDANTLGQNAGQGVSAITQMLNEFQVATQEIEQQQPQGQTEQPNLGDSPSGPAFAEPSQNLTTDAENAGAEQAPTEQVAPEAATTLPISQIGQITDSITDNLSAEQQVEFATSILRRMGLQDMFKAVGGTTEKPQATNRGPRGQFVSPTPKTPAAQPQQATPAWTNQSTSYLGGRAAKSYFRLVK